MSVACAPPLALFETLCDTCDEPRTAHRDITARGAHVIQCDTPFCRITPTRHGTVEYPASPSFNDFTYDEETGDLLSVTAEHCTQEH
jgi:hypothetical protein